VTIVPDKVVVPEGHNMMARQWDNLRGKAVEAGVDIGADTGDWLVWEGERHETGMCGRGFAEVWNAFVLG
jgi:hypothetical protein